MTSIYEAEILDAHMHLWDLTHGDYPWLKQSNPVVTKWIGSYKKICKNFLIDDYLDLIKHHNVSKCVHIEASTAPEKAFHETEWLQKIADVHGFPHAIIPYADLRNPNIENILKDLCQFPNVRGIRQVLLDSDLALDLRWQRGLKFFATQQLVFELSVFDFQIPDIVPVVKAHDDVLFVLEHLGWPLDVTLTGLEKWKQNLSLLARCPNVYLKLNGIGLILKKSDLENVVRFLHAGIEIFGENRCFFGSNIPTDLLFLNYNQIVTLFKETLSVYNLKTQRKIFYENAQDFYDI